MTAPEDPPAGRPDRLRPRVKVWFQVEGSDFGFGSGLIAILEAVERRGSIKEAAGDLGRSYRHIWARLKRAERHLGLTLVETRIGGPAPGRSGLTDAGRDLVRDFLALRGRMIAALDAESPPDR